MIGLKVIGLKVIGLKVISLSSSTPLRITSYCLTNPNLFSTDPLTLRLTRTKYVRVGPLAVGEIEPLLTSVVVQVAKQQVAFVQKKAPSSVFLFPLHFSC